MSVQIFFTCDGCENKVEPTLLNQYRRPIDVAPDGWLPYDPYTGCCYCPDCVETIFDSAEQSATDSAYQSKTVTP